MIAIHPWIRGFLVGFAAFWVVLPFAGFNGAVLAADVVWIVGSLKFGKDQQAFEARLLRRQRLYKLNAEQAIAQIQKALANAWLGESHWQNRVTDLAGSYMLYRYEWREPQTFFDDGKTRHHANLQIECEDRSDVENTKVLVTYAFDGLPNLVDQRTFYDAIHVAMGAIDAHLPDHEIVKPQIDDSDKANPSYVDHEMARA